MAKSTEHQNSFLLIIVILTLLILQVQPQQNGDFEEAELYPSVTTSISKTPTTNPPAKYPHNILRKEVTNPGSNTSCIIFQAAIQLHMNISLILGKNAVLMIDVPVNPVAQGTCGSDTQMIRLDWDSGSSNGSWTYTLEIQFGKNNDKQYDIQEVHLIMTKYNASTDPKELQANLTLDAKGPFYPVNVNHSYLCISNSGIIGSNLTMLTTSLQFEAFRHTSAIPHTFSTPQACSNDNSTSGTVIGIAVGSVLVLLIAIAFGLYVGIRYGYCRRSCCNRGTSGYQRLDI